MSHFLMGKFTTFFLHKAFNQQIDQHGHRINVRRENWEWYIDYIWRELKLFTIESIEEATMKAIAIEAKNKRFDKKEDKPKSYNKSNWNRKGK